jgi:parvulin-like peptidyl-prolyl isomerase
VRVSQILLKTDHEAVDVLHKVRGYDEETFRRFAREFSIGPEAGRGGDMGLYEMNQLPYEMEKVIFSLQTGQVSDVFASVYGFHIFRLDERLEAKLMTEEEATAAIRALIVDQKREKALTVYLNDLKQNLEWKTLNDNLPFTYRRKTNE